MNIKLIDGLHITSTEKKAIKYLIDTKNKEGYTILKKYKIVTYLGNNLYQVEILSKYTRWVGENSKWHSETVIIKYE